MVVHLNVVWSAAVRVRVVRRCLLAFFGAWRGLQRSHKLGQVVGLLLVPCTLLCCGLQRSRLGRQLREVLLERWEVLQHVSVTANALESDGKIEAFYTTNQASIHTKSESKRILTTILSTILPTILTTILTIILQTTEDQNSESKLK